MSNTTHHRTDHDDVRRASTLGAYVATAGAVVLLISVWLDWITLGEGDSESNPASGYETEGVIPFMGYLALGFALALLYAARRADRRQHRGLSLASFAVGLASLLWTLTFLIDPIATVQYDQNVSVEFGPWLALLGTLLWTAGSFLLAKEPEGDLEETHHTVAQPVSTHTETRRVDPGVHPATVAGTTTTGSHSAGGLTEGEDRTRRPGTHI